MSDQKVPLGAPLPLSDADLDALAEITEEDIAEAKQLWKEANPDLADLLDVVEEIE